MSSDTPPYADQLPVKRAPLTRAQAREGREVSADPTFADDQPSPPIPAMHVDPGAFDVSTKKSVNPFSTPQLYWRALILLVCGFGLLSGERQLVYFTTQSNVLVLIYMAGAVYWMFVRHTADAPAPRLRGTMTLGVVITALVAHFLLSNGANPFPGLLVPDAADALVNRSTFAAHYAVPALVLLDWIFFGPHVARWLDTVIWTIFPIAYGLLTIGRGALWPSVSTRYPYPFLDPRENGWAGLTVEVLRVLGYVLVLALVVFALDRLSAFVSRRAVRLRAR